VAITIFADCASVATILTLRKDPTIKGFTTNPSLAKRAGVTDYAEFVATASEAADGLPISFEVLSDDREDIVRQARLLQDAGDHIYVKIPICHRSGALCLWEIQQAIDIGIHVNITSIFTQDQAEAVFPIVERSDAILSVFAGRIADTGREPGSIVSQISQMCRHLPDVRVLWASPRQLLDMMTADRCGADIITLFPEMLAKRHLIGKDLSEFSRETVAMFLDDANSSGFWI